MGTSALFRLDICFSVKIRAGLDFFQQQCDFKFHILQSDYFIYISKYM